MCSLDNQAPGEGVLQGQAPTQTVAGQLEADDSAQIRVDSSVQESVEPTGVRGNEENDLLSGIGSTSAARAPWREHSLEDALSLDDDSEGSAKEEKEAEQDGAHVKKAEESQQQLVLPRGFLLPRSPARFFLHGSFVQPAVNVTALSAAVSGGASPLPDVDVKHEQVHPVIDTEQQPIVEEQVQPVAEQPAQTEIQEGHLRHDAEEQVKPVCEPEVELGQEEQVELQVDEPLQTVADSKSQQASNDQAVKLILQEQPPADVSLTVQEESAPADEQSVGETQIVEQADEQTIKNAPQLNPQFNYIPISDAFQTSANLDSGVSELIRDHGDDTMMDFASDEDVQSPTIDSTSGGYHTPSQPSLLAEISAEGKKKTIFVIGFRRSEGGSAFLLVRRMYPAG